VGFDKGLVSAKIDVWLNGKAFNPVFKWCLSDLQMNLSDKSYSRITGFIYWIAHINKMVLHLDVGLSFPNGKQSIWSGSAHPITRYVSWVQNDVNQFGLYL